VAVNFKVDWCSHKAAKYACETWHYSKSLPSGDLVKVGVWENDVFIGCIIFSRGATPHIASPFALHKSEVCELTRVSLNIHTNPVSKYLAIALRFIRKQCPGLKLIVSYADNDQGHHGGIYQATNWKYIGTMGKGMRCAFMVRGVRMHPKSVHSKGWKQSLTWLRQYIDPNATEVIASGKHKYIYVLDDVLAVRLQCMVKPYPKKICVSNIDSDVSGYQPEKGSANLTDTLQEANNGR
jgi:hypothetical protein